MRDYEKSSGSLGSSDMSDGSSLDESSDYFSSDINSSDMNSSDMNSSDMTSSDMNSSDMNSSDMNSSLADSEAYFSSGVSSSGSLGSSDSGVCCVQINFIDPETFEEVCAIMEYQVTENIPEGVYGHFYHGLGDIILLRFDGFWYISVSSLDGAELFSSDDCPHGTINYAGVDFTFGPCVGCGSSGVEESSGSLGDSDMSDGSSLSDSESYFSSEIGTCDIEWDTIYGGTLMGNPWAVSLGGSRIRFNIEDSANNECGGSNDNIQTGTATATITAGVTGSLLGFDFSGIAEEQDTDFEIIEFYLNDVLVASATSPGSLHDFTCAMGPAIVTYHVAPPYALAPDSVNTMRIEFTTGDALWHYGAYYEANFNCLPL